MAGSQPRAVHGATVRMVHAKYQERLHPRSLRASFKDQRRGARVGYPAATTALPERSPTCARGGTCPRCKKQQRLQAKLPTHLAVSEPGDESERQADRMADRVMRLPDSEVDAITAMQGDPLVQRRVASGSTRAGEAPPVVHQVLASPGQPLDAKTRAFFEPRFGHNFRRVRVHSGPEACKSARDVNAKAFTVGDDVVFGAGQLAPQSTEGRRLLAHELAHVVQHRLGETRRVLRQAPAQPLDLSQTAPLEGRLIDRAGEWMTLWLWATTDALNALPPVEIIDPSAANNFYFALGGNLLWAATSLMHEWSPAMIPMAFGGAIAAAGVMGQDPTPQPPTMRDALGREIAAARDRVMALVRNAIGGIAGEMSNSGLTDRDEQDRDLWRRLFRGIEFDSALALRDSASSILQRALDAYLADYRTWLRTTEDEAKRRLGLDKPPRVELVAPGTAPAYYTISRALPTMVEMVRREYPWDPEYFDVDAFHFHFRTPTDLEAGRGVPLEGLSPPKR
jgi:hypothetical protein